MPIVLQSGDKPPSLRVKCVLGHLLGASRSKLITCMAASSWGHSADKLLTAAIELRSQVWFEDVVDRHELNDLRDIQ